METGFSVDGPRHAFGPKARALSLVESRSVPCPHPLKRRLRLTRQSEQSSGELSDVPQYDKMASGERLSLGVSIALLLTIGGLVGLIAFAIAG
jgi:hypothetical protein